MEPLFLMLQVSQVIYLWLRAVSRGLVVTLVQSLPYTLVLCFCVRYHGEPYPGWLDACIWFSYGLLLAGEPRAWRVPVNTRSFSLRRAGRLTAAEGTH